MTSTIPVTINGDQDVVRYPLEEVFVVLVNGTGYWHIESIDFDRAARTSAGISNTQRVPLILLPSD